ncbi:hypothetical protein D3C86_2190770 [compost metagenome]
MADAPDVAIDAETTDVGEDHRVIRGHSGQDADLVGLIQENGAVGGGGRQPARADPAATDLGDRAVVRHQGQRP